MRSACAIRNRERRNNFRVRLVKRWQMTTSSQENDWAVWMRAAMTGDAGAYRQLLVSLAPRLRAVARSRCRSLGAPEDEIEDWCKRFCSLSTSNGELGIS